MAKLSPLETKNLPKPLKLRELIGPSIIILGVGLGSGEIILWPYLASNFGLGIIWAAVLGITFQFFINMEIERYTLICGESIFVGLRRKFGRFTPFWFILSTFLPWMWPGIAAASATLLAAAFGVSYSGLLGIFLLVLMGILYSLGQVVFKTQVEIQKAIILVGVPFIFILTLLLAKSSDWQALFSGFAGRGEGYWFLPLGLPFAAFLGALAYAGAGGNLNLAQSLYAKEKGYGMAKFSGRITNVFAKGKEEVKLEGATFTPTAKNLKRFKVWWKRVNLEHALVFWLTGLLTMILLSLLAFSTTYGAEGTAAGISFVIKEAFAIGVKTFPFLGKLFLILTGVMLFGTQFSVFGSTSRIMSENLVIFNQERFRVEKISKYFYFFLWFEIIAGVGVFLLGFSEPLGLVVVSAVLNAVSMFVYSGLVLGLNLGNKEKSLRPSTIRVFFVLLAFVFYGVFSLLTITQQVF